MFQLYMYMKLKHCFVPPLHHVALIPKCITWCVPWSLGWINPCPYDVLSMSWPFLPQVPFWRTEYVKTLRGLVKSLAHEKQFSLSHSRHPRFGENLLGGLVMSFCSQESLWVNFARFRAIFVHHLGCWIVSKEAWLFWRKRGIIAFLLQTNLADGSI